MTQRAEPAWARLHSFIASCPAPPCPQGLYAQIGHPEAARDTDLAWRHFMRRQRHRCGSGERWIPVPLPPPPPLSRIAGRARSPPPSCFTMSNSPPRDLCTQPVSFPRRMFCVRVAASLVFFVSTASLRCICRRSAGSRPYPWRQLQLRPRNEGPAERREAYHLKIVAPVKRDLTLARRARPAQPGRPPLGAPPWRCPGPAASPAFAPEPGQGWLAGHRSWPATDPGFDRGYEPRPTPHPAPPSGSSPETPLTSEDDKAYTIYSLRSQEINSNCSR
jgi:hypothetical protein